MKLPKKKIWYACGIPLVLIGGLFLWLALWANHWENRWETFKREAEAQGEDFSMVSIATPSVPDEENFLENPWVKSVVNGNKPSDADQSKIRKLLEQIRGKRDNKPTPLRDPEAWKSEAKLLLDHYRKDLDELQISAGRPSSWRDLSNPEHYDKNYPWMLLRNWLAVIELQYWHHEQCNERDLMKEDLKIFLQIANYTRSEPIIISQLVSLSMEDQVNRLIQADLEKKPLDSAEKKLLLELLSQFKPWRDDDIVSAIRIERNMLLSLISKREYQKHLSSSSNQLRELWQKNLFVQRTLLARYRLALCEDLQTTIITPYRRSKNLEAKYFQDHVAAIEQRIESESSFESFANDFGYPNTSVYEKLKKVETTRNDLIQQLSQSP